MTLAEIAAALGCSRSTASRLRAGSYSPADGALARRYTALRTAAIGLQTASADAITRHQVLTQICRECPRASCAGCRIAEINP